MEFLLVVHYMELSDNCVAEMKISTYWHKVLSNARKVHGKYTESKTFIVAELLIRQLYFPDVKEVGQRN